DSMVAAGDTLINEGIVWGWRMLSPNWRGLWGGEMDANSLPLDYNSGYSRKVVVLMSDGWNSFIPYNYKAFGWLWDSGNGVQESTAEDTLDTNTKQICDNMKAAGIEIFTVGFGNGNGDKSDKSSVNATLLQSCATDLSHFFLAPTNEQLESA